MFWDKKSKEKLRHSRHGIRRLFKDETNSISLESTNFILDTVSLFLEH